MGHFSYSCGLTSLPITGGDEVVLIPMVARSSAYDNDLSSLRKYGKSSLISNDSTRLYFIPCMFPIKGKYDDYGGIEEIEESDATKVVEEHFGLTIQQITNIITCHRKDDGYSDALDPIRDKTHPQRDDNGDLSPKYLKKYEPLLRISAMWVRREVYEQLETLEKTDEYSSLDLGTPGLLKKLGFEKLEEKGSDDRYNQQFKKGDLIVNSDGTWINVPKQHIYTISQFAEYCESQNEPLDPEQVKIFTSQGRVGQMFDVTIPNKESLGMSMTKKFRMGRETAADETEFFTERLRKDLKDFTPDVEVPEDASFIDLCKLAWGNEIFPRTRNKIEREAKKLTEEQEKASDEMENLLAELMESLGEDEMPDWIRDLVGEENVNKYSVGEDIWDEFTEMHPGAEEFFYTKTERLHYERDELDIARVLMNTDEHYSSIDNKLTFKYFDAIKQGKNLKRDAIQFSFLNTYMYVMGKFYMPPGTSPQDGEHESVYKLLELGMKTLEPRMEQIREWAEED